MLIVFSSLNSVDEVEEHLSAEQLRVKADCMRQAAAVAAEGYRILYTFPLEEAARRAVRPGGPGYEDLLERIADKRLRYLGSGGVAE